MAVIVVTERKCFVIPASILLCSGIDMRIEFELVPEEHNHITYISYRSDEVARPVP